MMRLISILVLVFIGLSVFAQKPTRSWDGKYYYAGDYMKGWIVIQVDNKRDTVKGYIKQYLPYDDIKSCKSVIFKKKLSSGKQKYDAADIVEYFRYDELYVAVSLPNKKKAFAKQQVLGNLSLYSCYSTKSSNDFKSDLSFSSERESVRYDYISKNGKTERIDWVDPYVYESLKVWFADCLNFDNSGIVKGMTIEDLIPVVEMYNSKCK